MNARRSNASLAATDPELSSSPLPADDVEIRPPTARILNSKKACQEPKSVKTGSNPLVTKEIKIFQKTKVRWVKKPTLYL